LPISASIYSGDRVPDNMADYGTYGRPSSPVLRAIARIASLVLIGIARTSVVLGCILSP